MSGAYIYYNLRLFVTEFMVFEKLENVIMLDDQCYEILHVGYLNQDMPGIMFQILYPIRDIVTGLADFPSRSLVQITTLI